ncbi:MAG: RdgB/HAM1 family non-canonical purine NTP pyrophosphatase [Candidatus Caldarchaeum sp.]
MSSKADVTFVTSNKGKAREVGEIFKRHGMRLKVFYGETMEIQSDSLSEVAVFRALHAYRILKRSVFVEDAGLFIKSLGGFPGPYSSYVYRTIGLLNLLKMLDGKDRRAYFQSTVCYYDGASAPKLFEGVCRGFIAVKPSGTKGFGFDPVFVPEGENKTFAQMSSEEKNIVSHRGVSVGKLCRWLYKVRKQPNRGRENG